MQRLPIVDGEKNQVLVIAGDLGLAVYPDSYIPFLRDVYKRFFCVIYIMGNHEHYNGSFITTFEIIKRSIRMEGLDDKIFFVEKDFVTIDNFKFICATLWTDMDRENPLSIEENTRFMADYDYIKTGDDDDEFYRGFSALDSIVDHEEAKKFIFSECTRANEENMEIVVVTHHAPSHQSVAPRFKSSRNNGAFVSELSYDILDLPQIPKLWIHGHVHNNNDYMIGSCRVVSNPQGYGRENQSGFNPELVIEL